MRHWTGEQTLQKDPRKMAPTVEDWRTDPETVFALKCAMRGSEMSVGSVSAGKSPQREKS